MSWRRPKRTRSERLPLEIMLQGWVVQDDEIVVEGVVMALPSKDGFTRFHSFNNVFGAAGTEEGRIPDGPFELIPLGWRLVVEHQINNVILADPAVRQYLETEATQPNA